MRNDWHPTASVFVLKQRAQIIAQIRDYFAKHDVLEVETPALSISATTSPNLHSFGAYSLAPNDQYQLRYLHTSPEFAMKRLLAAGYGSIYQICHVFRGGESGRLHNPEFTMLEWYRVNFDMQQLMTDVVLLVTDILSKFLTLETPEMLTYSEAFQRYCGLNPHTATSAEFAECAQRHAIQVVGLSDANIDGWRDLLLTHIIEPKLGRGRLTFLYHYPATQAALARINPSDYSVAERFELYFNGIELANGFHELGDVKEQSERFLKEREERIKQNSIDVPHDKHLLAALQFGLPECSGVALGLDRLVMIATNANAISDVIAFPIQIA